MSKCICQGLLPLLGCEIRQQQLKCQIGSRPRCPSFILGAIWVCQLPPTYITATAREDNKFFICSWSGFGQLPRRSPTQATLFSGSFCTSARGLPKPGKSTALPSLHFYQLHPLRIRPPGLPPVSLYRSRKRAVMFKLMHRTVQMALFWGSYIYTLRRASGCSCLKIANSP